MYLVLFPLPPGPCSGNHTNLFSVYLSLLICLCFAYLFSSVQSSISVISDSLRPHELQHARLPYPSLGIGWILSRACSNSCPLSQWCHPSISSSVVPFSSCLQSFTASGSVFLDSTYKCDHTVFVIFCLFVCFTYSFSIMPSCTFIFVSKGKNSFKKYSNEVDLEWCFSFYSTTRWISYHVHIHTFFRSFPHICHYRILRRFPYFPILSSRSLLVIYLIYR